MAAMEYRPLLALGAFIVLLALSTEVDASIQKYYMSLRCGGTLDMERENTPGFKLALTQFSKYSRNMNCRMTVRAPPGQQLMIRFLDLDIDTHFFSCKDYVSVFDVVQGAEVPVPGMTQLCGEREPRGMFTSTGDTAILHFVSDSYDQDNGFDLLVTAFHAGSCNSTEFRCGNSRCISSKLKCNGYNNCGDGSDVCGVQSSHIAVIVVTIIILGIAAAVIVFICQRRQRRRGQVLRAQSSAGVPLQSMNDGGYPQTQPAYQPPGPQGYAPPGGYPPQPYPPPQGYPPSQGYPGPMYPPPGSDSAPPPYPGNPYGYGNPEKPPYS